MRKVTVFAPSFPAAPENELLAVTSETVWQVLCGDLAHWRCGLYSPAFCAGEQIKEFEEHTCPELFLLIDGQITLVLLEKDGQRREISLCRGQPILVTKPHNGYCPDGPHTGRCLVVERDEFQTIYQSVD